MSERLGLIEVQRKAQIYFASRHEDLRTCAQVARSRLQMPI